VLARYRSSVDMGVPTWASASTYRIGQALVEFGEALQRSERPADLHGDDLAAYDDVLGRQAQAFFDRGEGVWTDLLRKKAHEAPDDPWIHQAQDALWQRLGNRFFFRPETDFPLIQGEPASRGRDGGDDSSSAPSGAADNRTGGDTRAHKGGSPR